jgi:hypothetical protein
MIPLTIGGLYIKVHLDNYIEHRLYREWWRERPCETTATDPPLQRRVSGAKSFLLKPQGERERWGRSLTDTAATPYPKGPFSSLWKGLFYFE